MLIRVLQDRSPFALQKTGHLPFLEEQKHFVAHREQCCRGPLMFGNPQTSDPEGLRSLRRRSKPASSGVTYGIKFPANTSSTDDRAMTFFLGVARYGKHSWMSGPRGVCRFQCVTHRK